MNKNFNIIPIKKNSKIPAVRWLKYQKEKFPPKDLCLYEGLNKAVICGKISNNLVILDFDFEGKPYFKNILNQLKDFKTFMVKTPHGLHVYFTIDGECPERRTQIKAKLPELKHFDILGEGGYALVPPSTIDDEFYIEINHSGTKRITREIFNKIVEIFKQKDEKDETIPNLSKKLNKLREPIQKLIKGSVDIEEMAAQTGNKEFLYWKAVFLETRANGIPDNVVMGLLAKSQQHFDTKTTTIQLRQIKAWEQPYTNLTLKGMFNKQSLELPKNKLEEAWVSIARDLMDFYDVISMADTKQLMIKKGNIYTDDTKNFYRNLGFQLIDIYKGKSYKHKRSATIQLIEDITKFERADFCYDRWIINFKNGYFDIKKNKFFPAEENTDKTFCYEIPHEYHSGKADCPYFKQLLIEWLGEGNIVKPDDIFEMIGYTMTMTTHLKMAFMIYGKSNTGKTAFQNVLSHIIGIKNISTTPLHRFGSNEFGTDNLQFKILNMVGDMGETVVEDLSVFKNLTGGDIWVHAEYKGGKKFEFRNMVKIWNNVNFIPRIINTHDEAFFNRWALIPFPHVFPMFAKGTIKEIWSLIIDTPTEIQGILHECVKGCKRLIDRNEYFRREIIENTKHIWKYESDPLHAFIYDNCIEEQDETISVSEFKTAFNKFLYGKKRPQVSTYKLNDMLEARAIYKERSTTEEREYYYKGIGWKPDEIKKQEVLG